MKSIVILGSTGSVGRQTIEVIQDNPALKAVGLAAGSNWRMLLEQARQLNVSIVSLEDVGAARRARRSKANMGLEHLEVLDGSEGTERLASLADASTVVHAIPGFQGIRPLLASLHGGKRVALAGKEALVSAGELLRPFLKAKKAILPVDSEHSAIFQCMRGEKKEELAHIILTASGGAMRDRSAKELAKIVPAETLKHPTWDMGPKVTVDSATLFNKALEVMEAHFLFGVDYHKIKVVIHRQSIVHSMVTFKDGSTMAQLAKPDMRLPISYALNYPQRRKSVVEQEAPLMGTLTFEEPDLERFPCLGLGYEAGQAGGTAPCVLSRADEIAVESFLSGRIGFVDIYEVLRRVLRNYQPKLADSVEVLEKEAKWAAAETEKVIAEVTGR